MSLKFLLFSFYIPFSPHIHFPSSPSLYTYLPNCPSSPYYLLTSVGCEERRFTRSEDGDLCRDGQVAQQTVAAMPTAAMSSRGGREDRPDEEAADASCPRNLSARRRTCRDVASITNDWDDAHALQRPRAPALLEPLHDMRLTPPRGRFFFSRLTNRTIGTTGIRHGHETPARQAPVGAKEWRGSNRT